MFLVDDAAVDVSRLTGIPWSYERVHQRGVPRPFIDLDSLTWWERFRIAWTLIGANFYLEATCTPQFS